MSISHQGGGFYMELPGLNSVEMHVGRLTPASVDIRIDPDSVTSPTLVFDQPDTFAANYKQGELFVRDRLNTEGAPVYVPAPRVARLLLPEDPEDIAFRVRATKYVEFTGNGTPIVARKAIVGAGCVSLAQMEVVDRDLIVDGDREVYLRNVITDRMVYAAAPTHVGVVASKAAAGWRFRSANLANINCRGAEGGLHRHARITGPVTLPQQSMVRMPSL